jgi:hypothetical protein
MTSTVSGLDGLGFALMDVWICAKLAGADNEIMPSLPSSQEEAATNF